MLAFREIIDFRFGATDFYYVCLMNSSSAIKPKHCERELIAAEWWSIDKYLAYLTNPTPIYRVVKAYLQSEYSTSQSKSSINKSANHPSSLLPFTYEHISSGTSKRHTIFYPSWIERQAIEASLTR